MADHGAHAEHPFLTIEEYARLPEDDRYRDELVRGRLVREPRPGAEHGDLTGRVYWLLTRHVRERGGGVVLVESGYVLSDATRTVRGPDVSFVLEDRLPPEGLPTGFLRLAPDIAVEVVSPSNTAADMQEKVLEYLDAGTRLVWVVYPKRREVVVFRSREDIRVVTQTETLTGEDVLPGLEIPLRELFARE